MMTAPESFDPSSTELEKGVSLLEASAGTGKTYTLARIFLRLIAEEGVAINKILTVTFTTAATEELRDRIRTLLVETYQSLLNEPAMDEDSVLQRLRNPSGQGVTKEDCIRRLRLAIACFDEAMISTIHGFCNRLLVENSFETQTLFESQLNPTPNEMIAEAVREYWRDKFSGGDPLLNCAASSQMVNPDGMVDFINTLPKTQDFEFGFLGNEEVSSVEELLVSHYRELKNSWIDGKAAYIEYVTNCLGKNARIKKNCTQYVRMFDQIFRDNQLTVTGVKLLGDVCSTKLRPLKDFQNEPIPEFCQQADLFCVILEKFGRAIRVDCVSFVEKKVADWKEKSGVMSFDDLLGLTANAVADEGRSGESLRFGLRQSFDAALIDEFQDTDPVQFEIFRRVFGNTGKHWLFLIGDPKQSIYRFRGADLEAYFHFAHKTNAKKYSLDTNYRTSTPLVEAVNAFFSQVEDPFLHKELPFSKVKPDPGGQADKTKIYSEGNIPQDPLVVREIKWKKQLNANEARSIIRTDMANEIHQLLAKGEIGGEKIRLGDIAILVRSNTDAVNIWKYFRQRGLPCVVFTDVSLFESSEAKELLWVLEGIVDSKNEKAIRRALATGLLGQTSKDFNRWQTQPEEWDLWVSKFKQYFQLWRKKGIFFALNEVLVDTNAISRNLGRSDGERRVTNLLHLAEVLHQATAENPLSPSSLVIWLRTKIKEKNTSSDDYQLRLESDSEAIQILTIHKSKGLEYPIVFLPSLSFPSGKKNSFFKYHREDGKLMIDSTSTAKPEAKNLGSHEEEEEDARILYVAVTRSASRCYLYHAPVKISANTKLPAQVRIMNSLSSGNQGVSGNILAEVNDRNVISEPVNKWMEEISVGIQYREIENSPEIDLSSDTEDNLNVKTPLRREVWDSERKIFGSNLVESFSGLTKQVGFDGKDLDGLVFDEFSRGFNKSGEDASIFTFPAGANAGNLMHDIFENLEFTDSSTWENLVSEKLFEHKFDPSKWMSVVLKMVDNVMSCELPRGIRLNGIHKSDRLAEMEFYFPLSPGFLPDLAGHLPKDCILRKYLSSLNRNDFNKIEEKGYLKGLIDLIFRGNGMYQVLDWKSNLLSDRYDGFAGPQMEKEMLSHHYVLQYHLYVVALNKFLESKIDDYSYENNFGGVYYLFVRGMQVGSNSGIFYDLPSVETIRTLDTFLNQQND
jgi:exodeoxyribonuclease V beta subunit